LANVNYAILESQEGNYQNSADYYLKAIELAEGIKYTRGLSISYNNIGENYFKLKEYAQAIEYTLKARDYNKSINESRGQAINNEQLGSIYFEKDEFDKAYEFWKKGYELSKAEKDLNLESLFNIDFGKYYIAKKQYNEAFKYLTIADSMATKSSEQLSQILTYKAFALGYTSLKDYDKAIQYLKKGLATSRNLGNKAEECDLYNLLATQYEHKGIYDSGIYYLRKHKSIGDSVLSDKNFAHLAFIQTQYETNLKEKENAELKIIQKEQLKKLSEKNLLLIASLLALMLALFSIFLVYNSFRHKRKNLELEEERKLSVYNQQIAEMEVKSLRSQMNPHFLFNSLNSIRNYIIKNESQLASDYLANFATLMRKILDASQQSFLSIEEEIDMLKLYLGLEQMRFSNKFTYTITVDEDLDLNNIYIPTMAIQPFIENAIWHGLLSKENGIGELNINILQNPSNIDEILCEIIDNGIGREKSESMKSKLKKHGSKGINITRERLKRLAKHDIIEPVETIDLYDENAVAVGTKVILHLPVE
jgi:sensor histidine kinase YesM